MMKITEMPQIYYVQLTARIVPHTPLATGLCFCSAGYGRDCTLDLGRLKGGYEDMLNYGLAFVLFGWLYLWFSCFCVFWFLGLTDYAQINNIFGDGK